MSKYLVFFSARAVLIIPFHPFLLQKQSFLIDTTLFFSIKYELRSLRLTSHFCQDIITLTPTIPRWVWNFPHKFHLSLICIHASWYCTWSLLGQGCLNSIIQAREGCYSDSFSSLRCRTVVWGFEFLILKLKIGLSI